MATITAGQSAVQAPATPAARPAQRRVIQAAPATTRAMRQRAISPQAACDRAKVWSVLLIFFGVLAAGAFIAWGLLGVEMIPIGGIGIALTIFLFGGPFWVSAIEEAGEQAFERALRRREGSTR